MSKFTKNSWPGRPREDRRSKLEDWPSVDSRGLIADEEEKGVMFFWRFMTMTIDLPVDLMEKVRFEASLKGVQLEVLLLEKIQAGVSARKEHAADRPWMKHFGSLRNFHDERKEIESRIEEGLSAISSLGGK